MKETKILRHEITATHEQWVVESTLMAYIASEQAGLPSTARLFTEERIGDGRIYWTFRREVRP
ncbi:MAG TPA: hypothetical protein VLN57_20850 [Xanthobacteraceae bacterium]|nr:hypothetical protein [Xanthobacteraceae bacterium]